MSDGSGASQKAVPETGTLTLEDGHQIIYTVVGSVKNPLLLFVVGSSGLGWLYQRLAAELSTTFRCVYYDKRGFLPRDTNYDLANSQKNPQVLVEQHADDGAALIQHLSPTQPAYIFGSSAGGVAVLDIAIRYPELVHTAILHEAMTLSVLKDTRLKKEMVGLYSAMADAQDPVETFAMFEKYMFNLSSPASTNARHPFDFITSPTAKRTPVSVYNSRQGQQEAVAMVRYVVDEPKAQGIADKLLIACGAESVGLPVTIPSEALATVLGKGKPVFHLPGDHMNFTAKSHASEFCKELLSVLYQEGRMARQRARM